MKGLEHRRAWPTGTVDSHGLPNFLTLPAREEKPRRTGITHVLDKGTPLPALEAYLVSQAHLIDYLKIGWGTAYIDPTAKERVALCSAAGVDVCLGGTLLEVCAAQGKVAELCGWAQSIGVDAVEVSNGLQFLTPDQKSGLIRSLSQDFTVLAETGAKSQTAPVVAEEWLRELESDLDAGATLAITEGRENGTVGLYGPDGCVRADLVEAIVARLPRERVLFEAPKKAQQVWLVNRMGAQVNIGNVPLDEVLALETTRLGLRADTVPVPDAGAGRE
ncbi:phosphosulfolactate synthase [Actinacidiphila yeochonensis]|uniref:phosphosulfolactate synthase n=1 Tax=Actinacidiphila yeochonensis TaxID=89050 RepID=UPI0018E2DFCB|nr:phosphosulfolactate synthase [Actinacidiphila yeochonensis]